MLRRWISIAIVLVFLSPLAARTALATQQATLLPGDFAGWHEIAPAQQSTSPDAADPVNASVLREYGFAEFVSANYSQPGNRLSIRAIRFGDATGAYGAFTFYRQPEMRREDIGTEGAFDGSHVLFWKGAVLVDASFEHLSAMSAAQLRELAQQLPGISGPSSIPPALPSYLPPAALESSSVRYALGPDSYRLGGGVLVPAQVGFDRDAEAVTAHYSSAHGGGTLTLLMYPTPQIARERAKAIENFLKSGSSPQWPQPLAESSSEALQIRRSGPILAITNGNFSATEARRLLESVNYTADVTWNHTEGYVSEASKTARLLLGIAALVGILGAAAILLGFFFGGGRALLRRLRGKPVSSLSDEEFIRLKLR
jgi:hypothetical protein